MTPLDRLRHAGTGKPPSSPRDGRRSPRSRVCGRGSTIGLEMGRTPLLGPARDGGQHRAMNLQDQPLSTCGGDAPVMVYAAEVVVALPGDATLSAVARELCDGEIGVVVIGAPGDAAACALRARRASAPSPAPSIRPPPWRPRSPTRRIVWCDRSATVHEAAELMMAPLRAPCAARRRRPTRRDRLGPRPSLAHTCSPGSDRAGFG